MGVLRGEWYGTRGWNRRKKRDQREQRKPLFLALQNEPRRNGANIFALFYLFIFVFVKTLFLLFVILKGTGWFHFVLHIKAITIKIFKKQISLQFMTVYKKKKVLK